MAEKIRLTFLGTGAVVPTASRSHPAILLQYKNENILVDCGEGTQRQFRIAKINPCSLTKVLITHWHGDHVLGLPGLLQTLTLNGYNRKLQICIPKGTRNFLESMLRMFVLRDSLKYEFREIDQGVAIDTKDFQITAEKMSHDTPTLAYSFIEKSKLRINKTKLKKLKLKGKIIGELARGKDIELNGKKIKFKDMTYLQEGKKVSFILDTRVNPNMEKIAKDSDLLICDSTYSEAEKDIAKEYGHLTAKQAAETAKKAKVKKLALVHLSQRYEAIPQVILREAKAIFKNTILPKDLDTLEI